MGGKLPAPLVKSKATKLIFVINFQCGPFVVPNPGRKNQLGELNSRMLSRLIGDGGHGNRRDTFNGAINESDSVCDAVIMGRLS
eukprot:6741339-Ditylum_brightwellii.AAC.2